MALTIADLEKLQHLYPEHRLELQDGTIAIMSPSDITASLIGAEFSRLLGNWVRPRKLGFVFDASGGFRSAAGDLTAPDVSYVSRTRLTRVPRSYGDVVPDLVVEVKSSTDRVKLLEAKLETYLELGAQVGLLIDPDERTVRVYRTLATPRTLAGDAVLELPELLPGFSLPIAQLWLVEYDSFDEV